jgi:hypothetical protein
MTTTSRVAFVRYNLSPGGSVPDSYKISPVTTPISSIHSVEQFNVQEPEVGPVGQSWNWDINDLTASKSITLTQNNRFSKDLYVRFTTTSLLREYEGIIATRSAAYGIRNYVSTLLTSNVTNNPDYQVYITVSPGFWDGTPIAPNPTTYIFLNPSQHTNLSIRPANVSEIPAPSGTNINYRSDGFQTGSDIHPTAFPSTSSSGPQYPGFDDFDPDVWWARVFINTSPKPNNLPYSITFNLDPRSSTGVSTYTFYGVTHNFDGNEGDVIEPLTSSFTLFKDVRLTVNGSATLQSSLTVQEQSQSVITGVQKTLSNNFTLSATSEIERFATATLIGRSQLLATTFRFLFADTVLTQSVESVNVAKKISNFSTALTLSTNFNSDPIGNMIYDLSNEYRWDDFIINGYFITGYTIAGYSAGEAEYQWDELFDTQWDNYAFETWSGTETGWDLWPEDTWSSSKFISTQFDTNVETNMIRTGVSNLFSNTALTDNSAYLIPAQSSIRSDFLCDGSPTGLIGGLSSITANSILQSLANYVINNQQNIAGAFNATLLANYIAKFLFNARSEFALTISPTFKPSGVTNADCIAVVNALANYIINNPQGVEGAFDSELIARIFHTTDPYNLHKVLQETRTLFVEAESRGIQIAGELRLNSIPAENRGYLIPQETRSIKLRIPPMTNRFTTPKVRAE